MVEGLNGEQRAAVVSDGHLCLMSCPGSGKTRTIVAKMLRCVEQVRGTPRKVGCITYTNAGVDEIESRLRRRGSSSDGGCYEVGTIHSFCLNNVLRPFFYRVPELANGFQVISPDDTWFRETVAVVMKSHGIRAWAEERFGQIQREPGGDVFVPQGITKAAAIEFLAAIDAASYVTLNDIVYYSHRLVVEIEYISRGLASRFAWLLIDEFQDTSACQAEILKEVHKHGRTKFFLVGDPNQSIFGFAGARPTLMTEVAQYIGAPADLKLVGNYRCSSRIVAHAERLYSTSPPMQAVGVCRDFSAEPQHIHAASVFQAVWEHFLPTVDALGIPLGEAAVLAPQWFALYHLARELRDHSVPVIGPGARPYKRSRDFAVFAENACAYLERADSLLATAVLRALFIMLLNITGTPDWRVYSYYGKRVLFRILSLAETRRRESPAAVVWLAASAEDISRTLVEEDFLPAEKASVITESAAAMVEDIKRNAEDSENLSTEDLGLFARPGECLQLMTMHRAKGREFDAVAVVDLHDGKIPHFTATTHAEIEEAKRLLYVATTRARKVLLYCTDSSDGRNRPSPFLGPTGLRLLG